ncbi:MAG: hypothetical protein ACI9WR_000691 [Paracoccaceae bacterium]|jgi:hypothetical protein
MLKNIESFFEYHLQDSSMFNRFHLLMLMLLAVSPGRLNAEIIKDLPDAVVCSVKDPTGFLPWEELVFYVSAHTRDGSTLYKTLTSDPVVLIVEADGIINASNLADCDGRHISELLEAGRAFQLTR